MLRRFLEMAIPALVLLWYSFLLGSRGFGSLYTACNMPAAHCDEEDKHLLQEEDALVIITIQQHSDSLQQQSGCAGGRCTFVSRPTTKQAATQQAEDLADSSCQHCSWACVVDEVL
jgi:hypothetical protein